MPLFADPPAPIPATSALHATERFVQRCRAWALDEISRRAQAGRPTHEWEIYLRFTDHTLQELHNGKLDPWFEADHPPVEPDRPAG